MTMRLGRIAVALLVVLTAARVVAAQDLIPTAWGRAPEGSAALDPQRVAWMGAWSPLRPISDLHRGLLRAPSGIGLIDAPPPVLGAFSLAGSAAALPKDFRRPGVAERHGELVVRLASEAGEFRRPLDGADSRVAQVSGQGWARVGTTGVAAGRFVLDRETLDAAGFTARVYPYASSPIIMTDSVQPPTSRTRARLEGALGIDVLGFGVGVAAGIESREHNTVEFPLRRSGRNTIPAATVGVDRELGWLESRVGAYYRWQEASETNLLNPRPQATEIYLLQGYDEPFAITVQGSASNVFTRNERRATATGATLDLSVWSTRIVAAVERGQRADDQTLAPFSVNRAIERWRAEGTEVRVQAQRNFGAAVGVTALLSSESHDGDGVRSDLEGVAFTGLDARQTGEVEVRWKLSEQWSTGARGGVMRTSHTRDDFVAQASADIQAITPFASGEVARAFGRATVAIGGSFASRAPQSGRVPPVADRGPTYQRLVAPGLAYEVAEMTSAAGWVSAAFPIWGLDAIASLRGEQTSARTVAVSRLQPGGDRRMVSVVVTVQ